MDRLLCDESPDPEVLEFLEAPGESGVIGDREAQPQEVASDRRNPSVCGRGMWKTMRIVRAASMARSG
jgi:hypothetical protein